MGNVKIGDKVPSINKLSEEFYLSRNTVERAYKELIDKKDMNQIRIVETMEDVVPILKNEIHSFYKK